MAGEELQLLHQGVEDEWAFQLGRSLGDRGSRVRALDLSSNCIGQVGCEVL